MLGIPLALVTANGIEWVVHKHVLHGLGRNKASFWSFHWHEHHREARQNDHVDRFYERSVFGWHAQTKEAVALVGAGLAFLPLAPVAPVFVATLWGYGIFYHQVHKRSHTDPDWARRWVPWHYDHHMGPNQDANWGVVLPWWDHVLGTREVYYGTEREERDRARRQERLAAKAAKAAATEAVPA